MKIWRNPTNPDEAILSDEMPGPRYLCVGNRLVYYIPIEITVDPDDPKLCAWECDGCYQADNNAPVQCLFQPKDDSGFGEPNVLEIRNDIPVRCKGCLKEDTKEVTA